MPKQTHKYTSSARRLAAIMFTDIVGYTHLMGEDEQKAMQVLRKNRNIHQSTIKKYHGRWLKEMGDGTLASFKTASEAVYCAGELIKACEDEDIKLRIGIHEGEVIEEDGDIFGDGVNIASRLEPLADPGQILVSGPVYRNIKNKPGMSSTFFKEAELKHVDEPVKIYQLSVDLTKVNFEEDKRITRINKKSVLWVAGIALVFLIGYGLSDYFQISNNHSSAELEKSIAVLPFKNMNEDKGNLAFSDGQWEAILSNLSKIADLKVISRQSMEQYRKSKKTARQIGRELGVSYLLEGSVQKYGNQTKITVQLIHAENDIQLWSHDYTQEIENIFSLQSEIALKVANELEVRLSKNESAQISKTHNIDPDIYELYLSAKYLKDTYNDTRDSSLLAIAIERFSEVIQKAPNFAESYVDLAMSFSASSVEAYPDTTVYLLGKALEIDEGNVNAHLELGTYFCFYTNDVEKGKNELERTLELDPNNMVALANLGYVYGVAKDFKKAVPYLFKFMQVNPSMESDKFEDRLLYYYGLNLMFKYMGMYEEAMVFEEKLMALDPNYRPQSMAFLLKLMGRQEDAFNYYLLDYERDTNSFGGRTSMAEAYSYLNQWEAAERYFQVAYEQMATIDTDIFKTRNSFYFRYGYVLWKLGKKEKATEMFDKHIKTVQAQIDNGSEYLGHIYDLAATYAFIGEKEKAIELLDKIPFWYVTYGMIRVDPMFDQIRDDPAFQKIILRQTDEMMESREAFQLEVYSDDIKRVLNR